MCGRGALLTRRLEQLTRSTQNPAGLSQHKLGSDINHEKTSYETLDEGKMRYFHEGKNNKSRRGARAALRPINQNTDNIFIVESTARWRRGGGGRALSEQDFLGHIWISVVLRFTSTFCTFIGRVVKDIEPNFPCRRNQ